MKSKWMVSHIQLGGEKFIQVYRLMDTDEFDYYGNREIRPEVFASDEEAEKFAAELNKVKQWVIDYTIRYKKTGDAEDKVIILEAANIEDALKAGFEKTGPLLKLPNVEEIKIWGVVIIDDDVF